MPSTILSDNGVSSGSAGLKTTAASDGSLALQTTTAGGTATTAVTIDTSQNVGLGVTPSAWGSTYTNALQLKNGYAALSSNFSLGYANLSCNAYEDGNDTWKYVNSYPATRYRQTISGNHAWLIAPSGTAGTTATFTQAMTLDSTGALTLGGAGTTKSVYAFNVINASTFGYSGNGYRIASIRSGSGDQPGVELGYDATAGMGIIAGATQTAGTGLAFWTYDGGSWAERSRLDKNGNWMVNTTTNPALGKLAIAGNNGVTGSAIAITNQSGTSQYYAAAFYNNGNSVSYCGSISISGTTTQYATSSDYRLKENIAPMTGALATVAQLKPCTYSWKSTGESTQGFIAHELQAVVPECVIGEKDAVDDNGNPVYQGIDTSFLVATLTAAIQELNAKVDAQAAEIAALKGN